MAKATDCHRMASPVRTMNHGRNLWKYRPPPTGLTSHEFRLCKQFEKHSSCRLGIQCVEAHGIEEFNEWVIRWKIYKEKITKKIESKIDQTFLRKLQSEFEDESESPDRLFVTNLPFVEVVMKGTEHVTLVTKPATTKWIILLSSSNRLKNICLLHDNSREHFFLTSVHQHESKVKYGTVTNNQQEWNNTTNRAHTVLAVTVKFRANVYGSFKQTVVFDFDCKPYLSKQFKVDVYPANEGLELTEDGKELIVSTEKQWTNENAEIIRLPGNPDEEHNQLLKEKYPHPGHGFKFPTAFHNSHVGVQNYKERMHALLYIEELAQAKILSCFNLCGNLMLTTHYILSPGPLSTAKYCNGKNELFGKLELTSKISEDTAAGRLILNNCNIALLSFGLDVQGKRRAYECIIEDKTKDAIYLRLHEQLVTDLQLQHGSEFSVQAQFQLNRSVFCEKHWAVDLSTSEILFPDTSKYFRFSGLPCQLPPTLNAQQQQAITAIASDPGVPRAPVVIVGPFGTGKTFTFAQGIEVILKQQNTRVLVCTHSNSAADLYVKDYLHPLVQNGFADFRPLRIYYRVRWFATVHHSVIDYCLVESDPSKSASFRLPTLDDIEKHRIIVTTLGTTIYLLQAGVPKGFFTHILIDEAAQCTECDVLPPLSLADKNTIIALAGDHMQLNSEVFSQVAREQQFQISLLERLYDHYPPDFPFRIVLCDNYRSHTSIVQFTSELFYDNRLKSIGQNSQHVEFPPLSFCVAKGTDVQDTNSASFYNMAEIYEIGEVVDRLQKTWPLESWGRFDENSIGVVSPYSDQVSRIRVHLRNLKLFGVNVERVLNVQGKQFRVIILSTVRTRSTCVDEEKDRRSKKKKILEVKFSDGRTDEDESDDEDTEDDETHFGFLSSARLLNTAVTRARSLVVVIGDPLALCSVGKCRKLWERYIELCRDFGSLKGISWMQLRSHLDALEMKKLYGLNPMAPEFVPNVLRAGQPLIMAASQNYPLPLPPFYPPPAVFPPYPPPPFHPQHWFAPSNSPRRQQPQLGPMQTYRPRVFPVNKGSPFAHPSQSGSVVPPAIAAQESLSNLNSSLNSSFAQLNSSFQSVTLSPRIPAGTYSNNLQDLQTFKGFDVSNAAMKREESSGAVVNATHRAISKPLTVQQLEAALLNKEAKLQTEPSWPSPQNNGSIWTPLSGPSLWGDRAIFTKDEESNKNDSVPLYLRTSNSNSQLSDDEMDLLVNSFLSTGEVASDDEDVPLWAEGNEELEDDLESKTMQFEESVLRSIRNENMPD